VECGANRVDDLIVGRFRGEPENLEAEHDEILASGSIVVERLPAPVEAPAVVFDRELGLGVAEVDPLALRPDGHAVLTSRLREAGSHEQLGDALLRFALTWVVAR